MNQKLTFYARWSAIHSPRERKVVIVEGRHDGIAYSDPTQKIVTSAAEILEYAQFYGAKTVKLSGRNASESFGPHNLTEVNVADFFAAEQAQHDTFLAKLERYGDPFENEWPAETDSEDDGGLEWERQNVEFARAFDQSALRRMGYIAD